MSDLTSPASNLSVSRGDGSRETNVLFGGAALPPRIGRLDEFAHNLWWSWHTEARNLFRALDYQLWNLCGHNPVRLLREIDRRRLEQAAADGEFLRLYDAVLREFRSRLAGTDTWIARERPDLLGGPVAFFSMEFAIHDCLPIYAGGLGVLAGDICCEASDLGLPMVGVGFMYPQGYFHQRISPDGWQEEIYQELDFHQAPVSEVRLPDGARLRVEVPIDDRRVAATVWRTMAGRTAIYLLDTNVEENAPADRALSSRLYTADREQRFQQEILLGIGGVRLLRRLGIRPSIWHANEGHTAFMMLERIRELVEAGAPLPDAIGRVAANSVLTIHTPVAAGTEAFDADFVRRFLHRYVASVGMDGEAVVRLGRRPGDSDQEFNMTALGLRLADHRNAVSELHGHTSRRIWQGLWPDTPREQAPIRHVTNGVHVLRWLAPELVELYGRYLGPGWIEHADDPAVWDRVADIPSGELWSVRQLLKRKLMAAMLERAQRRWAEGGTTAEHVLMMGTLLDPERLTIGFGKRFAEYKRPSLILRDVARLKRLVTDRWQPLQIVFAGKAHPADFASKRLLQEVYAVAKDPELVGRIAFVEDYDMHLAHYLTQGVDVWLNAPIRRLEASGTSGMKAALNGAVNLSVLDGWWHEGYDGANGWAVGAKPLADDGPEQDNQSDKDSEALYRLLERTVVPLYYDRDREGLPQGWIALIRTALRSIAPRFSSRRMLKEYVERLYLPAVAAH